jgi:hypothetical protein
MDKDKRQRRFGQKQRHIDRQVDLRSTIFKETIKQPHRLAKISFCTCGNSNCVMCGNPRKFFGDVTIQEQKQMAYAKSFERADENEDD